MMRAYLSFCTGWCVGLCRPSLVSIGFTTCIAASGFNEEGAGTSMRRPGATSLLQASEFPFTVQQVGTSFLAAGTSQGDFNNPWSSAMRFECAAPLLHFPGGPRWHCPVMAACISSTFSRPPRHLEAARLPPSSSSLLSPRALLCGRSWRIRRRRSSCSAAGTSRTLSFSRCADGLLGGGRQHCVARWSCCAEPLLSTASHPRPPLPSRTAVWRARCWGSRPASRADGGTASQWAMRRSAPHSRTSGPSGGGTSGGFCEQPGGGDGRSHAPGACALISSHPRRSS